MHRLTAASTSQVMNYFRTRIHIAPFKLWDDVHCWKGILNLLHILPVADTNEGMIITTKET